MPGEQLTPPVTVVLPVWDDYVRFLPEAVESVRSDERDVPIIVADNASSVAVPELEGASVVRSAERLTVGGIRNFGLQHVDSEYVVVLDADDKLLPGTLGFLASCLSADPSLSVCTTAIVDAETGERHRFPRRFVGSISRWGQIFAVVDGIWSLFPIQGCAIMRTAQVREAGGYPDANWGDDWVLAVSLAFRGRVEVHERLGRYYRHTPESLWRRERRARELRASARMVRDRLRVDPAVPGWARALLPLLTMLQLAAVYVVRPPYLVVKQLSKPKPDPELASAANVDSSVVTGFGEEWTAFDQSRSPAEDLERQFQKYFRLFPWQALPSDAVGFDLGCGSGRWAGRLAPRVKTLHCIDPSEAAISVARGNLAAHPNCRFHVASVDEMPLSPDSMDFGYSLGVLHHIPDTQAGIRACVEKLRPGAPLLLYLYYALDNRPEWFRWVWLGANVVRKGISRLPLKLKLAVTWLIAAFVYLPSARMARLAERLGADVDSFPLSFYRDRSFYTMRTDSFDRFATRIEKRFTADEIRAMMETAGLEQISFSSKAPYWCALGYKRA